MTEATIGGCSFVRVDVPALPEMEVQGYGRTQRQPPIAGFTKLYGNGAIYAMTFVDEKLAQVEATRLRVCPVEVYGLDDAVKQVRRVQPALPYDSETNGEG